MIGFHSINSTLHASFQNQKFHHAILLQGKKGVGKATFAREFVAEIFGEKNAHHPDLLLIEKEAEKKEITVDKIRKIADFVNQTSAISPHKFIIIDSACELNKSAANALLKILEEPHPNNFLILVSHKLHRVLPTIRSRCFSIKIPDLTLENFTEILRQKNPRISADELEFLSEICDNSPADAINLGTDLTRVYGLFLRSILNKKIGEELLKKISDKNFSFVIFEKIFEFFIARLLKNLVITPNLNQKTDPSVRHCERSAAIQKVVTSGLLRFARNDELENGVNLLKWDGYSEMKFFFDEQEVFVNLKQKFSNKEIFVIADETLILLHKTTAMSLDKKLSFVNIFNRLVTKS